MYVNIYYTLCRHGGDSYIYMLYIHVLLYLTCYLPYMLFPGMVEISTGSSLSAITPIITMEEGTKVWHLVCILLTHHILLTHLYTTRMP